ncbi:hypothetical protein [Meiothermus taiwanensis]|uniref:Cupin 2 conserved barrel domain-containing protein n=2 Tax=Meiothermus taiwanensis TaxID=172827 RepID=A0A399DUP8_9DEIN|nr:hypothetical protein [Meiothermus taiwanensis]AWR86585.1 hypothetical protein Mtai_v1c13430 [Meiothermus taiwanensis WR-220]KIQ55606.1 hypothetical protein SY28_02760 [Meiothermus taiwanensis]KZK15848.1 hypothetical protein A3962_08660 [Meiothermus taiwanensis]RIH75409.1 hypothetical protein Mcate_02245 [Meiothermus taiwanensis]
MKLHLVRLAKRQGQARFPGLEGFSTLLMERPQEVEGPRLYVLLEGELVIDLPDHSYLHLRKGEGAHLQGPHKITPIDPSVVAVWNPGGC